MKKRFIPIFFLIAYCVILIQVMVFKSVPVIRVGPIRLKFGGTHDGPANFVPFKTILSYLFGKMGLMIGGINIVGNIVLLIPIGFLVPFIFQNMSWRKAIVIAVASGISIELTQELLHVGIFDIDDVILNGIGVIMGYWGFINYPKLLSYIRSPK